MRPKPGWTEERLQRLFDDYNRRYWRGRLLELGKSFGQGIQFTSNWVICHARREAGATLGPRGRLLRMHDDLAASDDHT